jgi:threonyl-tRNA synthetase
MENQQDQENLDALTAEQLQARKEETKKFFEEAIPFLQAQHTYEKLLAEIAEYKLKRLEFDHQHAVAMYHIQNPQELEEDREEEGLSLEGRVNPETQKRKLKKN